MRKSLCAFYFGQFGENVAHKCVLTTIYEWLILCSSLARPIMKTPDQPRIGSGLRIAVNLRRGAYVPGVHDVPGLRWTTWRWGGLQDGGY